MFGPEQSSEPQETALVCKYLEERRQGGKQTCDGEKNLDGQLLFAVICHPSMTTSYPVTLEQLQKGMNKCFSPQILKRENNCMDYLKNNDPISKHLRYGTYFLILYIDLTFQGLHITVVNSRSFSKFLEFFQGAGNKAFFLGLYIKHPGYMDN